MNRNEFLQRILRGIAGVPPEDVKRWREYYAEMLNDRIEEGMSEEEAVADLGAPADIVKEILAQTPLAKLVKNKVTPKHRLAIWEIVLLAVGSPLWITLGAVALTVFLTLYAVLWTLVAVAWSVFAVFAACAPAGIALGVLSFVFGRPFPAIAYVGVGLVCAGLAIFAFFGCIAATKGCAVLTKKIALGIKKCFVRKERKNG